jgi:hypothetical protein
MMRLLVLLVTAICVFAQVEDAKTETPIRVLFLGNSYTYYNNLPDMVAYLSTVTPGRRIEAKSVTRGGATQQDLWNLTNAAETLRAGSWDYVVLQEHSTLGQNYADAKWYVNDPTGMHRWARIWHNEIQRKGAKTVFYLTWGRKARPEFQQNLNYAYAEIARELNAIIAPAGLAWKRVREVNPEIELFDPDGTHPAPAGTFLSACVFLETLGGRSCEGVGKLPTNVRLTAAQQKALVDGARYGVEQYRAGYLTALPKPDFGSMRTLPSAAEAKPADFYGGWKGSALVFDGVYEMELQLDGEGKNCRGRLQLVNARTGTRLGYALNNCVIEHSTLSFLVVDPRFLVDEFRAVLAEGKLIGTQQLRSNDPYVRLTGSFDLKRPNP